MGLRLLEVRSRNYPRSYRFNGRLRVQDCWIGDQLSWRKFMGTDDRSCFFHS